MSCYKSSNNKYFNCPPRMDDGRHFTDYRPSCDVHGLVQNNNGINGSFQYRMFLTQNSSKLMDLNRLYATQKNGCGPCKTGKKSSMLPEKTIKVCNSTSCKIILNDINGLGQGRRYNDEKNICKSWPTAAPLNKRANCCSQPLDLFNYYGVGEKKKLGRQAHPGGGVAGSGGDFNYKE